MTITALDVAFVALFAAVLGAVASPATTLLAGSRERKHARKSRSFELRSTAYTDALRESIRMLMFFDRAFPENPARTPSLPEDLPASAMGRLALKGLVVAPPEPRGATRSLLRGLIASHLHAQSVSPGGGGGPPFDRANAHLRKAHPPLARQASGVALPRRVLAGLRLASKSGSNRGLVPHEQRAGI